MERERLTRLLQEPGRVAREDLVGLKAMAERYPWFSGAHLLLAAGEHAAGEVLFDGTLATSSAHLPSRAVLFDLVEKAAEVAESMKPEAAAPVVEAPAPVVIAPEPVLAPPPAERVEEIASALIAEVPSVKEGPHAPPAPERVEDDVLEKQILEAALASAYDLTWQEQAQASSKAAEPEVEALPVQEKPKEQDQAQEQTSVKAVEPRTEASAVEKPKEQEAPASRITRTSKLRFTEWLGTSGPSEASVPVPEPAIPPVTVTDRLRTPAAEPRPSVPAPAPDPGPAPAPALALAPAPEPTLDTKALIDRFIQQETPPPARKAEFYTPQQAAKRSLDDTAGLVTETLARIYEKQGNLAKAIDAYRKLALKYPEKSAYFAALQKELEERSNP